MEYKQRQRSTRNWGARETKGLGETWADSWRKPREDFGLLGFRARKEMKLSI